MTRISFEQIAREALTEVLDELNYPKQNRHRICGLTFFSPPQDRDDTEFCADYGDGRKGYFRICLSREMSDEQGKWKLSDTCLSMVSFLASST